MKKIFTILTVLFLAPGQHVICQQLVRASDVQMVSTAGIKVVINGGITFTGTTDWKNNGETYLIKNTVSTPEGWLDSTSAGALNLLSTGNVFFKGSQRQCFYGKTKFYDLTIRNSIGDTLLSSCEVRNTLNLDTGFIFTPSGFANDSLWVSNTSTSAIASTSNFTKSWVSGRLSRSGDEISPFYLFPIGKTESLYAPIKLQKANSNITTWTAEYTPSLPFDYLNVFNPPIDHISGVEYWEITSNTLSGNDGDARLSLSWRGYSRVSNNASVRDSLLVAQYINRSPFIWDVPGGWVTGNTAGADNLFGYVTSNATSNSYTFAERRFTLGTYSKYNTLPVKLLNFTAVAEGKIVKLNWEIANEQDVRWYELEKSSNSFSFVKLSALLSKQKLQSAYTAFDYSPASGWNYYRLKVIDKNGQYFYSDVKAAKFASSPADIKIFPNPATEVLYIQMPFDHTNKITLNIYNADGKLLYVRKPVTSLIQVTVNSLAAGIYSLQIIHSNGEKQSYRFVKE